MSSPLCAGICFISDLSLFQIIVSVFGGGGGRGFHVKQFTDMYTLWAGGCRVGWLRDICESHDESTNHRSCFKRIWQ